MKISGKIISVFLIYLLLSGCAPSHSSDSQPNTKGLLRNQVIQISGTERNYHLYIPDYPKDAPVVFLLHGNRGSHDKLLGLKLGRSPYKVWLDIAKRESIILAIPNGAKGSNGHQGWNDCRSDAQTNPKLDDVRFISSLIDSIVDTYGADPEKVYALGTSNGGHMAIRLANEIPEKLAAFGAVAAANPINSQCAASTIPISAIIINGTSDPLLPYEGGRIASDRGNVHSTENTVTYWVQRNNTDRNPLTITLPDMDTSDQSTIEKREYIGGMNNSEVVFYKVIDGGHTEPSIKERYRRFVRAILGNQNGDIEMAEEVWSFFKTKSR